MAVRRGDRDGVGRGVPGLRLGASAYYCGDVTANADKPYKYSEVGRSSLFI